MASLVILIILAVYGAIAMGHFAYLYDAAKRLGFGRDTGRLTFVGVASLFWPITWIWFFMDRIRGRVA